MEYDPLQGIQMSIARIEDKLDKHDDKFDTIAETLQLLVRIDVENKDIKKRLETVETHQSTEGCPAHKSFLAVRSEQLKGYDQLAKKCEEHHKELDTRLKVIEEIPKKRLEVAIVEVIKWATIIILGIVGVKIGLTK